MFGDGSTSRDYTFIKDIVSGILASLDRSIATAFTTSAAPSRSHWPA